MKYVINPFNQEMNLRSLWTQRNHTWPGMRVSLWAVWRLSLDRGRDGDLRSNFSRGPDRVTQY